jgi:hypothetical protein
MKTTEGQKQLPQVFTKLLSTTIDPVLLAPDHNSVQDLLNYRVWIDGAVYPVMGDDVLYGNTQGKVANSANHTALGIKVCNQKVVEVYWDASDSKVEIWIDGVLCGDHYDLGALSEVSMDYDPVDDNLVLTSIDRHTLFLNIQDMINNNAGTKYKAAFDWTLYTLQGKVQLDQPVFAGLSDVGVGGGLVPGSYSYSFRFVDADGNRSTWGPSTPMIPVPWTYEPNLFYSFPGTKVLGGNATMGNSRYGIKIRTRLTNLSGYSYVEIKRVANKNGTSIDYSASPEIIALTRDANGVLVNLDSPSVVVITFLDRNDLNWLTYSEVSVDESTSIQSSRKVKIYDNRIVLAGVKYESKAISGNIFAANGESKVANPIMVDLKEIGYSDVYNQTYMKSYMSGEKYGFGLLCWGDFGSGSFVIPIEVNGGHSLRSYQFPNRREVLTGISETQSITYMNQRAIVYGSLPLAATIDSYNGANVDYTFESFTINGAKDTSKTLSDIPVSIGDDGNYRPIRPTKQYGGYADNSRLSDISCDFPIYEIADNLFSLSTNVYRPSYWARGLAIQCPQNLPSWVRGFSVVRTQAAKRVVCQGIGMYAISAQGTYNGTAITSSADKYLNRFWLFAPDIDGAVGIEPLIFEDIINNPSKYKIQLVSPLGFTTRPYAGVHAAALSARDMWNKIDMVTHAHFYYENYLHNGDSTANIGRGDGYVSFGRFRNTSAQAAAIDDNQYVFGINNAYKKHGGEFGKLAGRGSYLEVVVDSDIYNYDDDLQDSSFTDTTNRNFHEPWYMINIIQEGADIVDNNINTYLDIGHHQKLSSIIGIGTGLVGQKFEIVDERPEDYRTYAAGAGAERVIYVNGQKWLDMTYIQIYETSNYSTARTDFSTNGYFVYRSVTYYGMYSWQNISGVDYIIFPHVRLNSSAIIPASGVQIEVRMDVTKPINIFGGDTTVGMASFCPVDIGMNWRSPSAYIQDWAPGSLFLLAGPMPHSQYEWYDLNFYKIPFFFEDGSSPVYANPTADNLRLDYIRQWMVTFICESRMNLSMAFGDGYPYGSYVLRPAYYTSKNASETTEQYYSRIGVHSSYYVDYGDEYVNWGYGGFRVPASTNFDYSKELNKAYISQPTTGYTEVSTYSDRLIWSLTRKPGVTNSPSFRTFPVGNYYDLSRMDMGAITFIHDSLSPRGNNLCLLTERGCVMLLTNKVDITDVLARGVAMAALEGSFIGQEIWLSTNVGCTLPGAAAEGNVQFANGQHSRVLVFPSFSGVKAIIEGSLVDISGDYRPTLLTVLQGSETSPAGVIDELNSEYWMRYGNYTYMYNFRLGGWNGRSGHKMGVMTYANLVNGSTRKGVIVGARNNYSFINQGTICTFNSANYGGVLEQAAYIKTTVVPVLGDTVEYVDFLLNSTELPTLISFIIGSNSASLTILKDYGSAYYNNIPRGNLGRLEGDPMTVMIYTNKDHDAIVRSIRTGVKEIVG